MSKPVEEVTFWQERLKAAEARGNRHEAVGLFDFDYIDHYHQDIILREAALDVLDVGCGYGRIAGWPMFNHGGYAGIDIVPEFIEIAERDHPKAIFFVASADTLPFFKHHQFATAIAVSLEAMIRNNCGEERWQRMRTEILRVADKLVCLEYTLPYVYSVHTLDGTSRHSLNGDTVNT